MCIWSFISTKELKKYCKVFPKIRTLFKNAILTWRNLLILSSKIFLRTVFCCMYLIWILIVDWFCIPQSCKKTFVFKIALLSVTEYKCVQSDRVGHHTPNVKVCFVICHVYFIIASYCNLQKAGWRPGYRYTKIFFTQLKSTLCWRCRYSETMQIY